VSNLYTAELVNKTSGDIDFELKAEDDEVKIQFIRKESTIKKGSIVKVTFFVIRAQKDIEKYKSEIELEIFSAGKKIDEVKTNFIAPPN
jgi:hypothetical protein